MTWTPSDMRILYLEDEVIIAMETVEVLKEIGFTDICMAYSLTMAEEFLAEGPIDIALLDVNLSHGRTSFELGGRIMEEGTPVVFATGYTRASLPADPRALVIEKPTGERVLARALEEATRNRATN